jgi:hypothetical protein
MGTFDLVVARFNEDLAWLRRVPASVRICVYDKSDDTPAPAAQRVRRVHLPNVGREAHTYLHHMAGQYEALADVTVFVQGKPFDHVPDLHKILRGLADGSRPVADFEWLGFVLDWDDPDGNRLFRNWSKNRDRHPLPLRRFHDELFGEPCPERVMFYPGAHVIATRDCIRRRPRAFYERALAMAGTFPEAAHCFERCWNRVFGVRGMPADITPEQLPIYTKPIRRLM